MTGADLPLLGGRYQLVRHLADGGMAEVWEADDVVLGRAVAVKVLHAHLAADAALRRRFRAEAVASARLRHPAIVTTYDTVQDGGTEAIVMELVHGRTLRRYLDERGPLPLDELTHVGTDVAEALAAAHRAGVVHRDVKPGNILLCDDGRVLVADFGIAKVRDDADLTGTGLLLGTARYLAPEQVEGAPVDARTDLYALGVVLYEAACGRPPFTGDGPVATALARLQDPPPPLGRRRPDLPEAWVTVVHQALARLPGDRFASGGELADALIRASRAPAPAPGAGPPPPPPPAPPPLPPPPPPPVPPPDERTTVAPRPPRPDPDATTVAARPLALPPPSPPPPPTMAEHDRVAPAPAGAAPPRRRWAALALAVVVLASVALAVALLANAGRDLLGP